MLVLKKVFNIGAGFLLQPRRHKNSVNNQSKSTILISAADVFLLPIGKKKTFTGLLGFDYDFS
jgi:hypothetical protein